ARAPRRASGVGSGAGRVVPGPVFWWTYFNPISTCGHISATRPERMEVPSTQERSTANMTKTDKLSRSIRAPDGEEVLAVKSVDSSVAQGERSEEHTSELQ